MKQKRLAVWLLLLALLVGLLPAALASTDIVQPTQQLYVADYAGVLSQDTEDWIVTQSTQLKSLCGGEIAVVTIDFLNDLNAEEYCYELINQWGVGDSERNNGTVLLLVPGEGKGWITRGNGLEDYLTDARLDTILNNYLWDDFDAGNYDSAVVNTVNAVLDWYESYYGISLDSSGTSARSGYIAVSPQPEEPEMTLGSLVGRFFWLIVFVVLVLWLIGSNRRSGRRYRTGSPLGWLWLGNLLGRSYRGGRRGPNDWNHRGPGGFGGGGFGGFGGSGGGFSGGNFGGGGGRGGGAGRR